MWTRKQYEDAAQQIGNAHTASNGAQSINDLALKVAQDNGLNPEGIRTVVRLANVAVFENMFKQAGDSKAPDRMFDFSVGDPEQVINQLGASVKVACEAPGVTSTYDRTLDYYGDINYRPQEKIAAETVHAGVERPVGKGLHPLELQGVFKRAEEVMTEQRRQAENAWISSLEKAAQLLKVHAETPLAKEAFEKNAVASFGADIVPELRMVRKMTGSSPDGGLLDDMDKVAEAQEFHLAQVHGGMVDVLNAVKEASEARALVHRYESAALWAQTQRAGVAQ
jgi:hypothetical protein